MDPQNPILAQMTTEEHFFMESSVIAGDTAWVLTATALVLMMTPALGFFYGGMVRKKNILSTLNLSFITYLEAWIQTRSSCRSWEAPASQCGRVSRPGAGLPRAVWTAIQSTCQSWGI